MKNQSFLINQACRFVVCLFASLMAYPVVPVAAAFSKDGRLPSWAWWLETHDNLGWDGPLSEGYPINRWGLIRWLWRNKAYALRNLYRADPDDGDARSEHGCRAPARVGPSWWLGKIGPWWELELSLGLHWFRVYVRMGWKLRPYFDGHIPSGPSATGIMIPFSVRTDDWSE